MTRKVFGIALLCVWLLALPARASGETRVYSGGPIYVKAGAALAEAVVVEGGRFAYVGSLDGALEKAGADAEKIDLNGRMMAPSFIDAHAHPDLGSVFDLRDYSYAGAAATPDEYAAHIKSYLEENPALEALRGSGWENGAFPDGPPSKALLDQVSTEIPIFIHSSDQHSAWVNSKALELAGIGRDTPDAKPGNIERDEAGEPVGTLRDEAMLAAEKALPPVGVEEQKALILKFQDMAHSFGITGFMSALVEVRSNLYAAYRELHQEGKLTSYVELAFLIMPDNYEEAIAFIAEEIEADAASGEGGFPRLGIAKFLMDGAIVGQTGYLLEDYSSRPGYRGEPIWPGDAALLKDAFGLCEENGIRIHVHAVGDAAVRLALDGLEAVEPNRHAITHLELIAKEDVARFGPLGIIATINPYWFCKSVVFDDSELVQLGPERSETMFPVKSLLDVGVHMAAASDYPVTATPNPLIGMEMAVTRTLIEPWCSGRSATACAMNTAEAISAEQALDAFTLGAAYAYDLENVTGSIEAGKSADFIVLDKSILEGAASEARVLETWFQGRQVYCLG